MPPKPPDKLDLIFGKLSDMSDEFRSIKARVSELEGARDEIISNPDKNALPTKSNVDELSDSDEDDLQASLKVSPIRAGAGSGKKVVSKNVIDPCKTNSPTRTTQLVTAVEEFKFRIEHLYVNATVAFMNAHSEYCTKNLVDIKMVQLFPLQLRSLIKSSCCPWDMTMSAFFQIDKGTVKGIF